MAQGLPHAALAIQYWTIALTDPEPWKRLRGRKIGNEDWSLLYHPPEFLDGCEYEIIPATLSINGHEFPEPLRVAPAFGINYWVAHSYGKDLAYRLPWENDELDLLYLRRGRVHLTREDAEAHARADILAAGGEV